MKGKIDKSGNLLIFRKKEFKEQKCPFIREDRGCGGWCPRFEEPLVKSIYVCGTLLEFEELIDER